MLKRTAKPGDLVTPALRDPACAAAWSLGDWDRAVRQARRAGLLARLAGGLSAYAPEPVQGALTAASILAAKHHDDVRRELRYIARAIAGSASPVILLKGASYVAAGLPAASGRLFGDVDIMVPRRQIMAAEAALLAAGWHSAKQDDYDQGYYRRWMHEIPPLQHERRGTTIDVHHNIVPPTGAHALDADAMLENAVPAGDANGFAVLAPSDMVLHAAVHLFDDGEFANALRDLDDIDRLARFFAATPGFWDGLARRADVLGLGRPLYYALRYGAKYLGTPVPRQLWASAGLRPPGSVALAWMDFVFARALRPHHPTAALPGTGLALFFLYLRAHYLRMPLRLLIPHLLRKVVVKRLKPAAA